MARKYYLALAEPRWRTTPSASAMFLQQLATLDIEVDAETPIRAFEHVLPLARRYKLTTYDAAYLALAPRLKLPLATLDQELRAAARRMSVETPGKWPQPLIRVARRQGQF